MLIQQFSIWWFLHGEHFVSKSMTNIRGYSRTVGHESAVVPLPTLGKLEKPENQKITTLCKSRNNPDPWYYSPNR